MLDAHCRLAVFACAACLSSFVVCGDVAQNGVDSRSRHARSAQNSLLGAVKTLGATDFQSCVSSFDKLQANCTGFLSGLWIDAALSVGTALDGMRATVEQADDVLSGNASCGLPDGVSLPSVVRHYSASSDGMVRGATFLRAVYCNSALNGLAHPPPDFVAMQVARLGLEIFAVTPMQNVSCNRSDSGEQRAVAARAMDAIRQTQRSTVTLIQQLHWLTVHLSQLSELVSMPAQGSAGLLYLLNVYLPARALIATRRMQAIGLLGSVASAGNSSIGSSESSALVLCSGLFPDDTLLRPCPWLCRGAQLTVSLTDHVTDARQPTDTLYDLLQFMSRQCLPDKGWQLCLDPACKTTQGICANTSTETVRQQKVPHVCFETKCPYPLVRTSDRRNWNKRTQNVLHQLYLVSEDFFPNRTFNSSAWPCGLNCITLSMTANDEHIATIVIGVFAWLGFFNSLFVLSSFYLTRNVYNKYPTNILLYMYIVLFVATSALLFQFFVDGKSYICNSDNTERDNEPKSLSSGGSPVCVINFILTSFAVLSSQCWWLALSHAWYLTLDSLSEIRRSRHNYMKGYHLVAWTVPLVITITVLSQRHVQGFSLFGLCFTQDGDVWFYYYSLPLMIIDAIGIPLLIRGMARFLNHLWKSKKLRKKMASKPTKKEQDVLQFMLKLSFVILASFMTMQVSAMAGLEGKCERPW